MTQLDLHLPPRSHANDPETSRDAEARSRPMRGRQHRAVLALVLAHPGRTATELAEMAGEGFHRERYERRQQVRRRLSDLRISQQVRREGDRDGESLWWPVELGGPCRAE